MRLHFTKMQGAGNDFVVLDATRAPLALSAADYRFLGDRRFGVGADQILVVERSTTPGVDFRYRIFNGGSGDEVEQCGNGARCFARFVRDTGLSQQIRVKVETVNSLIELHVQTDGRVTVDMNQPIFDHALIPFDSAGLSPRPHNGHSNGNGFDLWPLQLPGASLPSVDIAVLSMGNPHAVQRVHDVDTAPVAEIGPRVETHVRFPRHVNVGFLQVMSRREVRLRVHERGAGETLACGTGACAAVVAGIRLGWLDHEVDVQTRGGLLTIAWAGLGHPVLMTGPAQTVFTGEIDLPTLSAP
jgi:diaminopimelate epimerase